MFSFITGACTQLSNCASLAHSYCASLAHNFYASDFVILPLCKSNALHVSYRAGEAQSVKCLAKDASLTAVSGVASLIPAQSHTFVEIDREIISRVIILPFAESFKKGFCQLQAKVLVNCFGLFKLAREKVWLGELTVPP